MRLNIRERLLLTFTVVTLVGGLLLFWVAGRQIETATLEFHRSDLTRQALTISGLIVEDLEHFLEGEEGQDGESLQQLIERISPLEGQHIILVDTSSRILADSQDAASVSSSLPQSPEVFAALNGTSSYDIRTDLQGESALFVAVPIYYEDSTLGVIRLSASFEPIMEEIRNRWLQLASAALPVVLMTAVISFWFGGRLSYPIRQLQVSALRIAEGALDERIKVQSHDEIGQLGQAFNFMAERLSAMLTAQRSFVSNAAHELRTPLMGLKLRIEELQDVQLSDIQRQTYLREAAEQINHMSELVGSLLVLARLDEGRADPQADRFDPGTLLRDTARQWRIQAQQAGIEFAADVPGVLPDLPITSGDLRIVLDNLLGNAIKYTSSGGKVNLSARELANGFYIEVKDTGEGFALEDKERLFERFFRADRSHSKHIPGTGLGLAIVQSVLARYGGTISAHSEGPGKGAAFNVRIPLTISD